MRTIFKYDLAVIGRQTIVMPKGSEILCIKTQNGEPKMWVLVETGVEDVQRVFDTFGTGHQCNASIGQYIDSYLVADDALVWHVFEYPV